MSTLKISEAAHLAWGINRRCDDALEPAAHASFQRCHHSVSCLANRNDKDTRVRVEIVQVLANAQHATFAAHMARAIGGEKFWAGCGFAGNGSNRPDLPPESRGAPIQ